MAMEIMLIAEEIHMLARQNVCVNVNHSVIIG
jgi:hypothetical protein